MSTTTPPAKLVDRIRAQVDKLEQQIEDTEAELGEAAQGSPSCKRTMKGWNRSLPSCWGGPG
ncbi:MAG TPA: hypothetical protein VKI44_19960 [Acetobacteraceae bacterium]|nr:hypothetical protein [Acetobacteraceae bacterium]